MTKAAWEAPLIRRSRGVATAAMGAALALSLGGYHAADTSFDTASSGSPANWVGTPGAWAADFTLQLVGLSALALAALMVFGGIRAARAHAIHARHAAARLAAGLIGVFALAGLLADLPPPLSWPLSAGLGGAAGDAISRLLAVTLERMGAPAAGLLAAALLATAALAALTYAFGLLTRGPRSGRVKVAAFAPRPSQQQRTEPSSGLEISDEGDDQPEPAPLAIQKPRGLSKTSGREQREGQATFAFAQPQGFRLPELAMLTKPKPRASSIDEGALVQNARLLEGVLAEFGVRGGVDQIRPGPVVTLYELVPAPGVKSARVVALSDDIARSMSVAACRVSVVPGRNAIGIELPNHRRETVYLRDLLASAEYEKAIQVVPLALGETIGGEPYVADLARMPHLLIAGTTGSGKSVGVNAMILSILYRLTPDECRFIMIDPKMLELSVYDGIPHLLAPVVTDPKKAIVALKWTVREMEDRYRRMAKIGVRNIAGYNERAREALARSEHFVRTVQTGFDERGRPIFEEETLRPTPMPFLVVVIDEVADLMMVAGKDIEGAVQRLAQMARAAGIHLIMATQRPSVDVITGTIKANFPTRIGFQVTSKIDSRTIMGEQGAEQLLGQGDMLYMAGGGRITRLHGPFVSDAEVETVARFLRKQGEPQYLEEITAGAEDDAGQDTLGEGEAGGELYDRAVAVVTRDRKASTSYIQRRLQIGYNRAASLMEKMEQQGVVGAANHAGKREVLAPPPV
ncbi:MAG: DNA translocase FtsK 4TM domain-containing protein [Caulobacteraceae bacterium]